MRNTTTYDSSEVDDNENLLEVDSEDGQSDYDGELLECEY